MSEFAYNISLHLQKNPLLALTPEQFPNDAVQECLRALGNGRMPEAFPCSIMVDELLHDRATHGGTLTPFFDLIALEHERGLDPVYQQTPEWASVVFFSY